MGQFIKEFDGLPQALQDWGKKAISQIQSPEKKHEAAKEVRQRMEDLWDNSDIEDIRIEEKVKFLLSELGNVDLEAQRLAEKYQIKENPRMDRIIGVILLFISCLLGIHAYKVLSRAIDLKGGEYGPVNMGAYYAGYAPGAEFFLIIVFTVIGLWLIFHSRKKER